MLDAAEGNKLSIAAGIAIGLAASFVQSLGITIQRKSHVLNQALPEHEQRAETRRPLWLLGFAIFFLSNVLGSLFQIAALPVVILAPLGAVSLLWNAFFARLLLGDVFSIWMALGTLLIAGGAVLIAIFGVVPEPTHSLEDLLYLFRRPVFVAYFSLLGAVVVIALGITHLVEYTHARQPIALPPSPPLGPLSRINAHDIPVLENERLPLLDNNRSGSPTPTAASTIVLTTPKPSRTTMFLGMSFASFSGILSGMCLIFAKSGVELLMLTVGGDNQFRRWETWVLLIGLAVFALLQLWYLHKSLTLANPTLVCPLAFCWYNLSSIVNSLVYFDQFSALSTRSLLLVILGIVILLGGVGVVSMPASNHEGGIEINTWHEDAEEQGEIRLDMESDALHGSPDNSANGPSPHHGLGLGRVWSHEPSSAEGVSAGLPSGPTPIMDITSPLGSPTSSRRRKPSGSGSDPFRRGSTHPLSPPLSTASLGGFAIGISAASPGFSVLPRSRGERRVASGASTFADVVARTQRDMRRTASEGDVGPDLPTSPLARSAFPPETHAASSSAHDAHAPNTRGRWQWLRGVFHR